MRFRCWFYLVLLCCLWPRAAGATAALSYRWKTSRVTVTWKEGNSSPELPALRRQVGHWKRLAHTLWTQKPDLPPLEMTVSLYGPDMGSDGPKVTLKSGSRTETVTGTITNGQVVNALFKLQDPSGKSRDLPADASDVRLSPDGQWISCVYWLKDGAEVRIAGTGLGAVQGGSHSGITVQKPAVVSVEFPRQPGGEDALIQTVPTWSPDSRFLSWIQGGRVVLAQVGNRVARLVTPTDKRAVALDWSPNPNAPLLVRFDDESFHLLDLITGQAVPISELLKEAAPMGSFFWSPSGRRLLFRTQSRIVVAGLTPQGKAARAWDQIMDRLMGTAEPPKTELGQLEERVAVLDLGARRLDTFPIAGTPLKDLELGSVNWSLREDLVFITAGLQGMPANRLVRFPLRKDMPASLVLEGEEPLAAVGIRPEDRIPPRDATDPARVSYAFVHGDRLLLVKDGPTPALSHPYSTADMVQFSLKPGPDGGYLGVEEEEEATEDEPARRVLLESQAHTADFPGVFPLPDGLLVLLPLDSGIIQPVRALVQGEVVDLDFYPDRLGATAVLLKSPGGGVGEIVKVAADPKDPAKATEEDVSARIVATQAEGVEAKDQQYAVTDVVTGTGTFAKRLGGGGASRLALVGVGFLALVALGIFLKLRLQRR